MDASSNPVHVILGGSGGIGSALARRLRADGAQVALAARDEQRLREVANEVGAVAAETLDASRVEEVETFVKTVAREAGRVDGIANCVGSILIKPAHLTSDDEWRDVMTQNLDTAFAAVRAAARVMRRGGGSVALVASAAARTGLASHEAIAAAKAGVVGLALSAAATYAPKGIRVNVVAPGLVETPLAAGLLSSPVMRRASEAMHPLGRLGRPGDVANALAWLLDPEQSWVTGQVLSVDGGLAGLRAKASA